MAGQATIGVSLQFNADVNAAKQNIQSLQQTLASLSKISTGDGLNFDKQFLSAKQSAIELKNILNQTFNQQTGRLDLRAFNSSIQASGKTLSDYRSQLSLLGADGDKAFRQMANAIMSAEVPLTKTNKLAASLWDSLKRTAKWQLSSSIIHGFMGAVQKAYGYAQDLNESLNNIRIVTGYNTDKMAAFAKEANAAAKALSTTTTAYTDASLIYFQQGLNDAQVKERADVTVKMANVTRQSAETVSDQMTAVWNNFAKGGENLESYADKMVALGAATASSSDEIAQGLEKFAAVADTVGLSFDYAAAALATVTAETRQSADTVGTAFKTLFARLESLSLGDTLEDGTDLTKYSKALKAVGIDVKNTSGELKDMDIILDELGAKWQTLAKDQQVALAQTVAGQRQYTQLVALMSNWDKFQENLTTTRNSDGALQEQADIYAESWEAAQKRVQAALEEIYDKLISSDGFINLLNGAEKFIGLISKIIDSLGGLQGVLSLVGVIITKIFSNEIAMGIDNLVNRIHDFSGQTAAEMMTLKTQASEMLAEMSFGTGDSAVFLERNVELQKIALQLGDKLSAQDLARIQNQIEFNNSMKEATDIISMELDKKRDVINAIQEEIASEEALKNIRASQMAQQSSGANVMNLIDQTQGMQGSDFEKIRTFSANVSHDELADISAKAATAGQEIDSLTKRLNTLQAELKNNSAGAEITQQTIDKVLAQIQERIELIRTEAEKASQTPVINLDGTDGNAKKLIEYYKQISAVQDRISKLPKISPVDTTGLENSKVKLKEIIAMIQKAKSSSGNANGIKDLLKINVDDIKTLEDLEKAINKVKEAANKQQGSLTKNLLDNGFTQQQIDKLRELGVVTDEVTEAERKKAEQDKLLAQQQQALIDSLGKQAVSIGEVVNGISNYAMTLSMAASTMGNWVKNLFDGKLTLEDFTSGIMALTTGLRILNTVSTLSGKLMDAYRHATELSALMTDKETAAKNRQVIIEGLQQSNLTKLILKKQAQAMGIELTTGAINKETGSLGLNTGGVMANALAWMSHPLFGPILAILSAVVLGIVAVSSAIKENTERIHENAEAAAQKAEETREEVKALNEQKQAYDDVYDRFKQGIATKDEYIEATSSLAEALGIENAAILIEQGRYEELNRLIDEYLTKKKIEAADAARESVKNRQKDTKTLLEEAGVNYHTTSNDGQAGYYRGTSGLNLGGNAGIDLTDLNSKKFKFINLSAPATKGSSYGKYAGLNEFDLENKDNITGAIDEINQLIDYAKANGASEEFLDAWRAEAKHLEEWKRKYFDANLDDFRTIVEGLEASGDIKTDFSDLNFDNYDGKIKEVAQTILDENLPGMTEEIANQLAQELVSGKDADLAKKIDLVDKLFKVSPEQTDEIKQQIHDFIESLEDDTTINYLLSLPEEELTKIANDLEGFKDQYGNQIIEFKAETNFDTARKAETEFADLNAGDTVEASKIESIKTTLEAAGISADNFFTKMADGTYLVKNRMAELSETLETAKIDNYTTAIESLKQELNENIDNASGLKNQLLELRESMSLDSTSEDIQKLRDLETEYNQLGQKNDELLNKIKELDYELANSATSFDQLDLYLRQGLISLEAYSDAYGKLREQFMAGTVDSEELATYTKYLLELDDALDESQQRFKGNVAAAEDFARSVMRMNSGIDKLAKGFKDWADVLQNSTEGSHEWLEAITDAKDAVADLLDVLPNDLPTNFITDNIDLIRQAATGSEEAIDALIAKLAELGAAELAPKLVDGFVDDVNNASDSLDALYNKYGDLKAFMEDPLAINLEDSAFIAALQNMLDTSAITREELDRILGTMNLEADYEEQKVTDEEVIQKPKQVQTWTPKEQTVYETYAVPSLLGVTTKKIPITRYNWELTSSAEMEPVTDEVERTAFAMTTSMGGQSGGTPKIKGVHKKATGSSSNYSKQNAGGGSPGGSKKSGGSGGSGGGSGSEITPKNANDEIERYHEIDKLISSLSKKLNELSTLKDRAWGGRHIGAIRAERAALEEYGGLLDQKLAEAEAYLQADAAQINAYGAQYDAQGHITNFNQIISNAVEAYNTGAMSDEEYSDLKKKLANYEDSLEKREDLLYEKAENARKILDSKFEEVEYAIEIHVEIDDKKIEYIEWLLKHLENKAFAQAETIDTAIKNYGTMVDKWDTYTKGIHDILATAGASETDIANYLKGDVKAIEELDNLTADALEHLGDYTEGLRDTYDQLIELKELIESQLVSVWEEWNDQIEHQIELMEHQDELLTHFSNIIDILGEDALGLSTQALVELSKAQVQAQANITEAKKANLEANQADLAKARELLKTVSAEEDVKYWEDEIRRLESVVADAEEEFYQSWEDTLQRAADLYDLTLRRAIKDFEKSISDSFKTFDEALELLDQKKTLAEQYIPEYKKLYELGKLNRDLAKELDKTNNLSAQKKLKDLQDEINDKMREGVQLSEYDLENLQKRYDLRLAEIALEDAQNAKNTVRLRRDANGNYGYVYTADESNVQDAVQQYEDKLYAVQEHTENYLQEMSEAYIKNEAEMYEALSKIRRQDYASDKEYQDKLDQTANFYTHRRQYFTNEIQKSLHNNQALYLEDKSFMERIYSDKDQIQRAFAVSFQDTIVNQMIPGFDSIEEVTKHLVDTVGSPSDSDSLLGQLSLNAQNWATATEKVLELNGTSFTDFKDHLEETVNGTDGINNKIKSIRDEIDKLAKDSVNDYNIAAKAIMDYQAKTSPKLQQLKTDTEAYTKAHLNLLEALKQHFVDPNNISTNTERHITENIIRTKYETEGSKDGGTGYDSDKDKSSAAPANAELAYWSVQGRANTEKAQLDFVTVAVFKDKTDAEKLLKNIQVGNYDSFKNNIHNYNWSLGRVPATTAPYNHINTVKLNTGGYTGSWGPEGRLAMLHEKELVLNKQDTSNMLSAVETIRKISQTIDLKASADKGTLINKTNIKNSAINDAGLKIDQSVTIQADFPAATDRNEIAEAFNQLMQQSLQYAYRYNE